MLLIQRIFPKRIWQQIFLLLVLVIIIPLVVLGLLLIKTSQKAIKTTVFRDHKEVAIHTTGQVKEHIEAARQSLAVVASILGTLHSDPWRQETAIVELALKNPSFQRIASLNKNGYEIATSDLGADLLFRDDELFRRGLAGESYISEIKISENHIPFLTLVEPVKRLGQVHNVLIADLNVRSVWDIVDNIKFGETGLAYLIDKDGRIVAHPDKKLILQNAYITDSIILEDIRSGQAGNTEGHNKAGERLLISYAPIHKLAWGLVIAQPEREAYAFSEIMKMQSWTIIGVSILFAILMSLVLAQYVSRPINDIIEGTKRLANGDFSYRFRIKYRNEIGKLFFSFNRMTAQLRRARDIEKLSVMGKAAASIAHELKNSLQLVTTFVTLLPERHDDKQFLKEFSNTIPKELASWNTSLKNMMTFSQSDTVESMESIHLVTVIEDVLLLAKLKARQLDIKFSSDVSLDLPPISGNKEKIKQVLLNLITNALESTESGGLICVRAAICFDNTFSPFSCIQVEVTNTFQNEKGLDLQKIFDPFFTTKVGGLGLGLAISKEIIERHSGYIQVKYDKSDHNITFLFRIPTEQVFSDHHQIPA